ncbi:MAG: signal peptidase II [Phycisphaerae bacterium]|nr:signal peptidase II [Phycisphaerae bacterium]
MNESTETRNSSGPSSGGSTWRSPGAWAVLLSVTAVGLFLDLWTKAWAFATIAGSPVEVRREDVLTSTFLGSLIPPHPPVVVIPGVLEFTLVLNPGAVFGMGAGKRWFFVVFTGAALAFGLALFGRWTRPRDRWSHAAIGLLLAGGLGNLYDRLAFACVRDFIHPLPGVRLPFGLRWPWGGDEVWPYVSNIADLWLIIGIGVLMIHAMRSPRQP